MKKRKTLKRKIGEKMFLKDKKDTKEKFQISLTFKQAQEIYGSIWYYGHSAGIDMEDESKIIHHFLAELGDYLHY